MKVNNDGTNGNAPFVSSRVLPNGSRRFRQLECRDVYQRLARPFFRAGYPDNFPDSKCV